MFFFSLKYMTEVRLIVITYSFGLMMHYSI